VNPVATWRDDILQDAAIGILVFLGVAVLLIGVGLLLHWL
jgi:hypothetical protein